MTAARTSTKSHYHADDLEATPDNEVVPLDAARLRCVPHSNRKLAAEENRSAGATRVGSSSAPLPWSGFQKQRLRLLIRITAIIIACKAISDLPVDLSETAHAKFTVFLAREDNEGVARTHEAIQNVSILAVTHMTFKARQLRGVDA
eukprot:CAMPEP_0115246680 /NCGR_PEP_ID=MMETSP0270-20121206/41154_1 /TAXON_ID=71861 /ORGANISM="Scrippsiella trochoidea, Strain CCMP3099" /LENGTH=146 /DNA_ID=CAMNT_0002661907 /DNA_START=70 /DNA_END=510 /DNA_ORIENTATION=+